MSLDRTANGRNGDDESHVARQFFAFFTVNNRLVIQSMVPEISSITLPCFHPLNMPIELVLRDIVEDYRPGNLDLDSDGTFAATAKECRIKHGHERCVLTR